MAAPEIISKGSEYNQTSFLGGMNLLGDDSRLQPNQYRAGFNLTNRYDSLDPVLTAVLDENLPTGIIQEIETFGNFIIAFVSGNAYFRLYNQTTWTQIKGFAMSPTAPRYWTCPIPIATTNYLRLAATGSISPTANGLASIQISEIAGAAAGNLPGLLVQDNINQSQFIFIGADGNPICRTTQSYDQWSITFTDATNTKVATDSTGLLLDNREYVPIGNAMCWDDGILYIVSQDFSQILRSVSGRPLDFVVNITNALVTTAPFKMLPGGDAYTTSYSVGVGGISCIKALSSGGVFVAAGNANFSVVKNLNFQANKIFGEFTFIRTFLFNATCLSDRAILDTVGDTRFVDLTGVRSFNSIQQLQNEGRNTPFTASIQGAFGPDTNPITQDHSEASAILFNNYELYAVNTIFGHCIVKYDTINNCWTSFDFQIPNDAAIKILAKIELGVLRLYAATTDNKLYTLYIGPDQSTASFRTIGVCSNILYANTNIRMAQPKNEVKLAKTRCILNKITEDCSCQFIPYVNNRETANIPDAKEITFAESSTISSDPYKLPDVDTQLMNLLFSTPDCEQGWKVFGVFTWTNGSFTQFSMEMTDITPENPLNSQNLS